MKKYGLLGTSLVILFLGIGLIARSPSAHAQTVFNYTNYLMNDTVFRASTTMSPTDIQTFLVNEGSGLANFSDIENCGSTSGAHYAYYATYYSCGSSEPASKIIYDAAQAYGINPQVILATLQKEQSLITTTDPTTSQLNCAMGYQSCASSYLGFFNQVDNATWQFRTDFELGSGNNWWGYTPANYPCGNSSAGTPAPSNGGNVGSGALYYSVGLYPGNNVTFYDYNGSAYAQFVLPNISTAALYCYTPHVYPGSSADYYSGSYWFVYYFNLWFPTLVSAPGSGVYNIEITGTSEVKQAFPSQIIFLSYGYAWSDVSTISSSELNQIPEGADITYNVDYRDGHLVSSPTGGIYDVVGGTKRPFPNEATFYSYGYTFSDALVISNEEINLIPDGTVMPFNADHWDGHLVTSPSYGIYDVVGGTKMPFPDAITYLSYGYSWIDPIVISDSELSQIPLGAAITYNVDYRDGHLVSSPTGGIYDVVGGTKRPFPNEATFYSYGYTFSDALVISNEEINLIPDGTVMPMNN